MVTRAHMPSLGGATEWLNSEPRGPPSCVGTWSCTSLVEGCFAGG
jgi:hypothetical protein